MSQEKNKRNLSKEAQEMKNHLSRNFANLQYERSEFATTSAMLEREEALEELLFNRTDDDEDYSFLPLFASGKKTQAVTAAGVPSRSEGAAAVSLATLPPIDNMGLHKYQVKNLNTEQQKNDALQNAIFNREQHQHKTLGGYDGGVEVGFKGDWNEQALAAILDQLVNTPERWLSLKSAAAMNVTSRWGTVCFWSSRKAARLAFITATFSPGKAFASICIITQVKKFSQCDYVTITMPWSVAICFKFTKRHSIGLSRLVFMSQKKRCHALIFK